jgi:hypothetical protein
MSLYPQTPQSIGQVLDRGFSMYRAIFKPMLVTSMALGLLAQLPALAQHSFMLMAPGGQPGVSAIVTALVMFLLWLIVYFGMYNGWVMSLDSVARGGKAYGFGQSISAGLPKILPVIGGGILFVLAFLAGLVLLVIPGIILLGSLIFFMYFIVLENQGALESLQSSHKLVWGNWWRSATILTVAGILYFVAMFIVMMVAGAAIGLSTAGAPSPEDARATVSITMVFFVLVQGVLNGLLMPLFTSIALVTFRDLMLRKSGADLAARAAAA